MHLSCKFCAILANGLYDIVVFTNFQYTITDCVNVALRQLTASEGIKIVASNTCWPGLLMRPEHSETKTKTETKECETEIETETETKNLL